MSLTNHYLITTKNLKKFLISIQNAQAPERFNYKFLKNIGFESTNDKLFISMLKSIDLLDESGTPTDRYYKFLDQTESANVLADGIRDAYEDLFNINNKAYSMSIAEVENKLKTLTQGKKNDKIIHLMANTFKALCEEADFKTPKKPITTRGIKEKDKFIKEISDEKPLKPQKTVNIPELHYNIQIILPETRDASVYDAIFKSLKEHIL